MSTENNEDLLSEWVGQVKDVHEAHKVIEALSQKFDLLVTVQPAGNIDGVALTVADIEQSLQEAVDNHDDAEFQKIIHELWNGVVEGLLDSPAIAEQDGSLVAPGYDNVDALTADYVKLLTTGPWQPLLGLVPQDKEAFGYFHGVYATLTDAYQASAPLLGTNAWETLDNEPFEGMADTDKPLVVESFNLFRTNPESDEVAFRIVP